MKKKSEIWNHQAVRKEVTNILQLSLGQTAAISFLCVSFSAFPYLEENNSFYVTWGWSEKSEILLINFS